VVTLPAIPADVLDWIRSVFADCNRQVAEQVTTVPTTHEEDLDRILITHLGRSGGPTMLPSRWVVQIQVHFVGGGRHWRMWEVADIGLLVLFRHNGSVVKSKLALLQSKRLYPREAAYDETTMLDYEQGFSRLWQPDEVFDAATKPRTFTLSTDSRYAALQLGNEQQGTIAKYQKQYHIPVHYSFYNPLTIPSSQTFPLTQARVNDGPCDVGCRVVSFDEFQVGFGAMPTGYTPSYEDVATKLPAPFGESRTRAGWRLEDFVVDRVIGCPEGYPAADRSDPGIQAVFGARGAPISAAVSITISTPPDMDRGPEWGKWS